MTEPCQCTEPGVCPRHPHRYKTPHLFKKCREREEYRALWDHQAEEAKHGKPVRSNARTDTTKNPCVHGDFDTSIATVDCPSCGGTQVRLKVFECAVHGRCTMAKAAQGIACCRSCGDYSPSL